MRRAAVLTLLVAAACNEAPSPYARAFQATNRTQLIGGVAAVADVGDFVLENDQVRVVILGGHGSPGPGIYGGSLADADLQRHQQRFRGGNGLDAFSELFPMVNLATPNPESTEVTIAADGSAGEATIRVEALADNYMDALQMLEDTFSVPMNVLVTTDYRLAPGSRVVRIDSNLVFNPSSNRGTEEVRLPGLQTPPDVFGTILRGLAASDGTAPGAVVGDFLFYGNKTSVFTPEYGFDFDLKLREIFNGGCDTINVPVGVDALAAEAHGVSYAYGSADEAGGQTYVPLFASSFTAVMTHIQQCASSADCLANRSLTYSRYFAIGDGDAASALGALYAEKKIPTGRITGQLFDELAGEPVSGARILVLRDPGADVLSDADLEKLSAEDSLTRVYAANRDATRKLCDTPGGCDTCAPELDLYGSPGIVTSMKSDRRADDTVLDGDFEASLPPGNYLLVARDRDRATAKPVRVKVEEGKDSRVNLVVGTPATVEVRIVDERGEPMPAKVTLGRCLPRCAVDADCGGDFACDPAQRRCFPKSGNTTAFPYEICEGGACTCRANTTLDVAMGDPLMPDNIFATAFAGTDGIVKFAARPGDWELIVSRGPEYDISFHTVKLDPRRPAQLNTALHRVIDSTGWISADFHVHGINSHDANIDHDTRVLSMMGEGVELVSSSDHDAITDFEPAVRRLGAQRFIKSQVGLEATTVELGHFLGAPVRFDQLSTGPNVKDGGVLKGDPNVMPGRGGAINWDGLPPGEASFCDSDGDRIFNQGIGEKLVAAGDPTGICGREDVEREPGIMGRLRDLGLFGPEKTVITVAHPRDGFFGYFDQYALDRHTMTVAASGSTLELLNPLVKPAFFDTNFDAIELFNGKRLDFVRTPTTLELGGYAHDLETLRSLGLPNAELERRQGLVGDKWVREIVKRTKAEQAAVLAGRLPVSCDVGSPQTCGDPAKFGCDADSSACFKRCGEGVAEACGEWGVCDEGTGRCVADDVPSPDYHGIVDDWFRLLNGGVKVTGVGNSDTHGLTSVESGLPRNWVKSSSDEPRAIDIGEIAESLLSHQSLTSYGPFIRLDVNGATIGSTVTNLTGAPKVRVSVESPLWFDVDRLELYRNGVLWQEVEAGQATAGCAVVDEVPNKQVVNFDCTFEDDGTDDAWYVAIAMGLRGKDLRPVYTSVPILALEIGDITGRAFGAIEGFPVAVGKPEIPRQHPVLPYAITNPIWVDRDGDGFDAPVPLSAASPFASRAGQSFPLTGTNVGQPPLPELDLEPEAVSSKRLIHELHRRIARALHGHTGPAGAP